MAKLLLMTCKFVLSYGLFVGASNLNLFLSLFITFSLNYYISILYLKKAKCNQFNENLSYSMYQLCIFFIVNIVTLRFAMGGKFP